MPWEKVTLNRRTIGLLDAERHVYRITRQFPAEVARRHDAYGIDTDTILRMAHLGVTTVEVEEHRGGGVRLYTTEIQAWLDGIQDALGAKGLPHRFLPISALPKPELIKYEPCGKRMTCCSGRCKQPVRHWALPTPTDDAEPQPSILHACDRCGRTEALTRQR